MIDPDFNPQRPEGPPSWQVAAALVVFLGLIIWVCWLITEVVLSVTS